MKLQQKQRVRRKSNGESGTITQLRKEHVFVKWDKEVRMKGYRRTREQLITRDEVEPL